MRKYLILCLFLSLIMSCNTDDETVPVIEVIELNNSTQHPVIIPLPEPPLVPQKFDTTFFNGDWEVLETMPVAPGHPEIPTPWSDEARRNFSEDIRYDFRKADGWEWVLGTFSYKIKLASLDFFIMYNQYKGLIRFYFYIDAGTQNVRDYKLLCNALRIFGPHASESPLMNFAGQEIVDVDLNTLFGSRVESWGIEDHSWYVVEHEVAFDRNLNGLTYEDMAFHWSVSFQKLLGLKINGLEYGSLPSAIKKQGYDFNSLDNSTIIENVDLVISGVSDLQKVSLILSPADAVQVDDIVNRYSYDKLLDGLIVGSNNTHPSHIHWPASMELNKDLNGVGVTYMPLIIPGMDNSKIPGLATFYNLPMGVFYLDRRPIVRYTQETGEIYAHLYKLDVKTVRYLFNPALLRIAEIKNIKQEIIATEGGDLIKDFAQPDLYVGQDLKSNLPLTIQGVRVSFDVVPKNGSQTVKIVKTFKADVTIN